MDIFFSTLDRNEVYRLPMVPENSPELSKSAKNEEFESFNKGTFNLLGNAGLKTFSIDSFLPEFAGKYNWAKSQVNPDLIINLWEKAMDNSMPIRCVITRKKRKNTTSQEFLNSAVTVENLSYYIEKNNDIKYKVDCKEYKFPEVVTLNMQSVSDALKLLRDTFRKQ